MNSTKSQKLTIGESQFCKDVARSVLAKIRSNGNQTKVYRAPIAQDSVLLNSAVWRLNTGAYASMNSGGVQNEYGLDRSLSATRWPATAAMRWNAGRHANSNP